MFIFQFNINNKTFIIFITALVWAFNFRTTFKNIDSHMDSGSYSSLKFNPKLILIKNIISCFFLIVFLIESRLITQKKRIEKEIVQKKKDDFIIIQIKEKGQDSSSLLNSISSIHRLNDTKLKILFWLKTIFIILVIYFIEELYFIIANNHILDRLICPIRNLGVLISLFIFSPLIIKKSWYLYKHQFIPLIIIFILSICIIFFNFKIIDRFKKIFFTVNFLLYLLSFILIGIEMVLIKYLLDSLFISIFLILGIKGIIGSFFFGIINIIWDEKNFFDFFDKLLKFEYEDMYMEFGLIQQSLYIISLLVLQYLKIYTISSFTENHLLSVLMITDIIYFPFYVIERFAIEGLTISTLITFIINSLLGFINLFLMLMFIEILECNCCGLNRNLVKYIIKRQHEDYLQSFEEGRETISDEDENNVIEL